MRSFYDSKLKYLMYFFVLLFCNTLLGQKLAISLTEVHKTDSEVFYDIILINDSDKDLPLAGQNYRLYYDSKDALYQPGKFVSFLGSDYTDINLVQHVHDVDASGFGVLPFDGNLGFVNLATDLKLGSDHPLVIKAKNKEKIARLCFGTTEKSKFEIIWARDGLTNSYATAFVELAYVNGNTRGKVEITDLSVTSNAVSSVQDERIENFARIVPNPFKDNFVLNFNHALENDADVEVLDVFGQLLQTKELKKGTDHFSLKGDAFPAGALLIKIRQSNGDIATFKAINIK